MANTATAGKSKAETEKKEEDSNEESGPKGSGWGRVNPDDSRLYAHKVKGAVYQGILVGRFQRNDGDGYYYQLRLTQDAQARDPEGNVLKVSVGETINVDEMKGLQDLQGVSEKEGVWEVFIRFIEKVKIAGGHTFWRVDCQSRAK